MEIKKIKEAVERKKKKTEEEEREIEEIVNRIKAQQMKGKAERAPKKLKKIKASIEGKQVMRKVEITKKSFAVNAKGAPLLERFGALYRLLSSPLSKVAFMLSSFPPAENLKRELNAAGIESKPEIYLLTISFVSAISAFIVGAIFFISSVVLADIAIFLLTVPAAILTFVITILLAFVYPSYMATNRAKEINRELPFALRQLSTQLKGGVSFHRALSSIAHANYGVLSKEFEKTMREIEGGASTEEALSNLSKRTYSAGLKKTMVQILRAMKTGGNLVEIISAIAEDVSFETRMSIRDFTEKLNLISIVYMMVAVVAPVMLAILSAVAQLPLLGGGFPKMQLVAVFMGLGGVMIMIIYFTKSIEPRT